MCHCVWSHATVTVYVDYWTVTCHADWWILTDFFVNKYSPVSMAWHSYCRTDIFSEDTVRSNPRIPHLYSWSLWPCRWRKYIPSKTSVNTYQSARRIIPQHLNLHYLSLTAFVVSFILYYQQNSVYQNAFAKQDEKLLFKGSSKLPKCTRLHKKIAACHAFNGLQESYYAN
jgi:hypothetical protein